MRGTCISITNPHFAYVQIHLVQFSAMFLLVQDINLLMVCFTVKDNSVMAPSLGCFTETLGEWSEGRRDLWQWERASEVLLHTPQIESKESTQCMGWLSLNLPFEWVEVIGRWRYRSRQGLPERGGGRVHCVVVVLLIQMITLNNDECRFYRTKFLITCCLITLIQLGILQEFLSLYYFHYY